MSENEKPPRDQDRKQSASPVCYLDQFPGYFGGVDAGKPDTDDTNKKHTEQSPEP